MSLKCLLALAFVLSTVSVTGQVAPTPDQIYQVIRNDDLAALGTLGREAVNARDEQGQTPLMWAAAFGSARAMRILLDAGADVTAAGPSGVTALHWAATDVAKTRMLLDAGADVNAVSQLGRTPLIIAASANATVDAVRLLLARGARVNVGDATGMTALTAAAIVDNSAVAELLLANEADVNAKANTGFSATPLMGAAGAGNAALVRALLAKGADVNAISADRTATVKNGPVQFGRISALHVAVMGRNPAVVKMALEAGASVNARDVRGMTPLVYAIATDRSNPTIIRMLVAAGADPELKSNVDEDAVAWAQKFQTPGVLAALKVRASGTSTPLPIRTTIATGRDSMSARSAVERSLPLLRTGADRTSSDGGCVACHAQPLAGIASGLAISRGWTTPVSNDVARSHAELAGAAPTLLQLREGGGSPDTQLYQALLLATMGAPASRATDAVAYYMAAKQRADGRWAAVGASRAPMQDGDFSRTAMAIRVLRAYALPARATEFQKRTERAATWLAAEPPISTEDRVMQLLGLHWAEAAPKVRDTRLRELRRLQRSDGGWAQTAHLESDAYATGQVLYALHQLKVPTSDPGIRRAVAFLLRTQREDGSWFVRSRAMKIQPYFESGFPYGHEQWISQAATAWAAIALTETAGDERITQRSAR